MLLYIVLSGNLEPPPFENSTVTYYGKEDETEAIDIKNHNYTDCCVARNVSKSCLGFCNIQSILDGSTGQDPENCEPDFKEIVKCMAGQDNVNSITLNYIFYFSLQDNLTVSAFIVLYNFFPGLFRRIFLPLPFIDGEC